MKKAIVALVTSMLLGLAPAVGAQTLDIKTCFVSAPDSLLPHLGVNSRKDLLDLQAAGQESRVTGRLGQSVSLVSLDERTLTLSLTEISTLQIALLPAKSGAVVAVIHTVGLPAADSRVRFYDTQWRPLDGSALFTPPQAQDFLSGSKKAKAATARMLPLLPVAYEIEGDILRATQHIQEYLPQEVGEKIAPQLLTAPLVYRWNGKRFVR